MSSRIQTFVTSSGFKLPFRLVSPLLMSKIRSAHPPPTPPLQAVLNADGTTRHEPNPDAPEYQATLAGHNEMLTQMIRIRAIRLAVIPWQWTDEQRARIDEIREIMGDDLGPEETDLVVYVSYELLTESTDFRRFLQAATKGGPSDPKSLDGTASTVSTNTDGQSETTEAASALA